MDLLKVLMDSAGGSGAAQLGSQFGLDSAATSKVLGQLLPALGQGLQNNSRSAGGLDSLMKGLQAGNHQQYLDNPQALRDPATIADGNGILGHVLGSKDASRNVAAHAAQESGVDASVIKKMLPLVAAMAMGALSKQTNSGRRLQDDGGGLLGSLLDSNQDGQVLDDVINLAKKLF